jgi:general secretion pathway protein D
MKPHLLPGRVITIACLALLFLGTHGRAQTARPGSSARGGTRPTTSRGSTGSISPNAGSTGPRQYRSNTLLGDATIQIDPETRSLVIVTDEDTHLELMKVIKTLDQPKPQVLIKVVFIEVTYNKGMDVGVEANYTFNLKNPIPATTGTSTNTTTTTGTTTGVPITGRSGTTTTNAVNQTVTSLTNTLGTPANIGRTLTGQTLFGLAQATDGTFVRIASDDWSATLRAMATKGKLEVLSRPSIMARNNQEAVIVVGQEVPFITNSRTDALG